jgi:hypothetical protein
MAFGNITAANSTFRLAIAQVYPQGVTLIGFGVDDAFIAEMVDAAETQIGVDGYGVTGYRPREVPMSVRFFPTSPSIIVFENWLAAEDQINDKLLASAIITMPATGRKYACQSGVLMRVSTMPEVRRVLASREWRINWLPQGPGQPAISAAPM